MDKNPKFIYDLDIPSLPYYLLKKRQNSIFLRVFNAKQWAFFDNYRCSDIIKFSILVDIRFTNGTELKAWSKLYENEFYDIKVNQDIENEFKKR
jgi:hypothetical protein